MDAAAELRRRYRRLLWAYPRWYRRYRGTEMLTTLLDEARPGQRRPTVGAALDILVGGVRCRFRPPSAVFGIVFVPVSVFIGLLCALAAIRLTFVVWAPMPTEDDGIAIAQLATGERPYNVPGGPEDCQETGCMEDWDPAGDRVVVEDRPMYRGDGMDAVVVRYWSMEPDEPTWVAAAWQRLAAAGWTVRDLDPSLTSQGGFTADKGDLRVTVYPAFLTVSPHRPPVAPYASAAGFVTGVLAGWLLAGWVVRRGRQGMESRRSALLAWGSGAVLLALLVDGMTAALAVDFIVLNGHPWLMVPTLLVSVLAICAVPAAIAVAVVLALAATATASPRPPVRRPSPL